MTRECPRINKPKYSHTGALILVYSTLIFASACKSSNSEVQGTAAISHPDNSSGVELDAEGFPPMTPTTAVMSFSENYTYDFNCVVELVHKCKLETDMQIGDSQTSTCRVQESEVEESACLPANLKNNLLAKESPTVTAQRTESNKYLIVITLTQGDREVFEVNSLEDLDLFKDEKEVGSL